MSKKSGRNIEEKVITLSQFLMDSADTDLRFVINAISVATKVIGNAVQHVGIKLKNTGAGMLNTVSSHYGHNSPTRLEVLAHDVMINALKLSNKVGVCVSAVEKDPTFIFKDEASKGHKYAVFFDPLDGSTNIECNISVGTTFAIFELEEQGNPKLSDLLQSGNNVVSAGYVLYGSATVMMLSLGAEIHSFTMDIEFGEFILHRSGVKIPDDPARVYSTNSGNSHEWDAPTREFVKWTKLQAEQYSSRYIGSMVSDVHRTLLRGGIFMYPADKGRNLNGKLKLLYECFPMAFLVEKAGGKASNGRNRILDLKPSNIHERSPIFLGCKRDVDQLEYFYRTRDYP
eukprot:m.39906 g.39906  ORF g.39906 m.39906 type:complete len:343 (-) comp9605_c0_seq2:2474-3502(-)